jgi:hypothetical protein
MVELMVESSFLKRTYENERFTTTPSVFGRGCRDCGSPRQKTTQFAIRSAQTSTGKSCHFAPSAAGCLAGPADFREWSGGHFRPALVLKRPRKG